MTSEPALRGIKSDLVMQSRAANAPGLEADAELDTLGGLQAHQCMRQAPIELAIPLNVAAEADRQSARDHLDDAAEGVAGLLTRVDLFDNRTLRNRIGDADLRLLGCPLQIRHAEVLGSCGDGCADADNVTKNLDPEWLDKLLCETADRDPGGRFTR